MKVRFEQSDRAESVTIGALTVMTRNENRMVCRNTQWVLTLDQVNKGSHRRCPYAGVVTCQTVWSRTCNHHLDSKEPAKEPTAFIAGMACRCICIGIPSIVDEDDPCKQVC